MKTDEFDFDLTLDNAKEHYINDLRGYLVPWEKDFYLDNFSKEEFLSWNEEMVYKWINKYAYNNQIMFSNIEELCNQISYLSLIISEYVIDKNIYIKRIELIKDLYSKYGYFMNYYITGYGESLIRCICGFRCHWYHDIDKWTHLSCYDNPSKAEFYDDSRNEEGLIPDLFNLKYYDLLDKYLEECFLPICLHYKEPSKFLDGKRMHYFTEKNTIYDDILEAGNIVNGVKYLRKINYKLPEKLDEFWKERGI